MMRYHAQTVTPVNANVLILTYSDAVLWLFIFHIKVQYELRREKTGFLHIRKQRHRSASR